MPPKVSASGFLLLRACISLYLLLRCSFLCFHFSPRHFRNLHFLVFLATPRRRSELPQTSMPSEDNFLFFPLLDYLSICVLQYRLERLVSPNTRWPLAFTPSPRINSNLPPPRGISIDPPPMSNPDGLVSSVFPWSLDFLQFGFPLGVLPWCLLSAPMNCSFDCFFTPLFSW